MPEIIRDNFSSVLLRKKIPYRVILPAGRGEPKRDFPVLYLLHGLFGSCANWTDLTGLAGYAEGKRMIIVMPEGGDGWYTDSATRPGDKYESYLLDEFMPRIEDRYGISKNRTARAVVGLSMGGYGALKFALKRPHLFALAGSISGAFDAPLRSERYEGHDWNSLRSSIESVFGRAGDPVRRENDLFRLIENLTPEQVDGLPELFIECGTSDGFLEINRRLAAALEKRGANFRYGELEGRHDWDFWDRRIREILPQVETGLTVESA